jgi:hypothetical protein
MGEHVSCDLGEFSIQRCKLLGLKGWISEKELIGTIAAEQSDLARLNAAQQQTPQPATSPSTDVLLQQILAALRNLDASTDPMVLAMLQQILDGQQAPMTLDQHAAAAAMAKALSR